MYSSSVYSYHLFLVYYTSVRSIPFLSFIIPIFAWNAPLVSLIFLKRSLVFPIPLFSSISLHRSLRKAFLSLLAILWNSAFKWVYLSFSPLPFPSLLFSALFKVSSDNHLPGASVRNSAHGKGHEEGGLAYAKVWSSLRKPPVPEHVPPKPESVLCSHLHLWLYGGFSSITISLGEGVNLQLQVNKNSWAWQECFNLQTPLKVI